jgi:HK97 family phage major capsid protein
MTEKELKALVASIVSDTFAEKMEEVMGKAREANAGLNSAQIAAMMAGKGMQAPAASEKGLKMAAYVRALAATKGDNVKAAQLAKKWGNEVVAAALSESVFEEGGAVVYPEFANELVELLYAATVVRSLGATSVPMSNGTFSIPFMASGSTASYVGENKNIGVTAPSLGMLTLTAKKLAAIVPISNDLLRDNSIAADRFVLNDLVMQMSLREDLAFIRGDGTQNTPKGLRYWADSTHVFAATQAGSAATLAEVTSDTAKMVRLLEEANLPMRKVGWIMTPRVKWFLMSLLSTTGNFVFRDEMLRGTFMTFPYKTTTQVPNNLGTGSNESELYLADFNEVLIGENMNISVDVSNGAAYYDGTSVVSGFSADQTVARTIARHDLGCRRKGLEVAVLTTCKWGA